MALNSLPPRVSALWSSPEFACAQGWVDGIAANKLLQLAARCEDAAVHSLEELAVNLSGLSVRVEVLGGTAPPRWRVLPVEGSKSQFCHSRKSFSMGMMAVVRRWMNGRLDASPPPSQQPAPPPPPARQPAAAPPPAQQPAPPPPPAAPAPPAALPPSPGAAASRSLSQLSIAPPAQAAGGGAPRKRALVPSAGAEPAEPAPVRRAAATRPEGGGSSSGPSGSEEAAAMEVEAGVVPGPSAPAGAAPEPAAGGSAEAVPRVPRIAEEAVPYELRFRLLSRARSPAAGRAGTSGSGAAGGVSSEAVGALSAAMKANAPPRALNQLAARYNLGGLSFSAAAEGMVHVFEVRLPCDPKASRKYMGDPSFIGPYEHGSTLAHRMLGDRLLKVSFEPMPDTCTFEQKEEAKRERAEIVRYGFDELGGLGRSFRHFCHKDVEKQGGGQLWFVAVDDDLNADGARSLLLDQHDPKLTLSKLNARLSLAFSQTCTALADFAFDAPIDKRGPVLGKKGLHQFEPAEAGHVKIVLVNDIYGREPPKASSANANRARHGGKRSVDADNKPLLMTDGAGLISLDLAQRLPRCQGGRLVVDDGGSSPSPPSGLRGAPCWVQCRVWFHGYAAKGMLVVDANLPSGMMVLRDSMVKVSAASDGPARCTAAARRFQAFEAVETSGACREGRCTPQLVPLLEHAGGEPMVAALLALQERHASRVRQLNGDGMDGPKKLRAIRDLGILPDSASVCAAELLLAGFDPSREPYLRSCVSRLVEDSLKKLAEGRVAIPNSVLLKGVPDPTSTLAEGEICVMQHGACAAAQEVLIYRSPGIHPGDVRKVSHVPFGAELQAAVTGNGVGFDKEAGSVIFFSVKGRRALADTLAGGDYDGDEFLAIFHDGLVSAFTNPSAPYDAPPAPLGMPKAPRVPQASWEVSQGLAQHWADCNAASGQIGTLANLHTLCVEHFGVAHPKSLALVGYYYDALDMAKTASASGCPRALSDELRARGFPPHLASKARGHPLLPSSSSALGRLWQLQCGDPHGGAHGCEWTDEDLLVLPEGVSSAAGIGDDPAAIATYVKWEGYANSYASEAQAIIRGREAGGPGRPADAASERRKFAELKDEYRERLLARWSDDDREVPPMELLREASAVYYATYNRARRYMHDPERYFRGLSFAWDVAGDYLCHIKMWRRNQSANRGRCVRGADIHVLAAVVCGRRRAARVDDESEDA